MLRLPGKGLPYVGQKRTGDLLVEIIVVTPTNLSGRQEELLREFEASADDSISEKILKGVENLLGGRAKRKRNESPEKAGCTKKRRFSVEPAFFRVSAVERRRRETKKAPAKRVVVMKIGMTG